MAHATAAPDHPPTSMAEHAGPSVQGLPVTPGKVAMWLFLATEIMFFTGLIGSYIVLRSGSPPSSFSDKYPPHYDARKIAPDEIASVKFSAWPKPYDTATNPLSIDLTAINTFILICSSVTMVLALSAVQRGDRKKLLIFLGATVLIGSCFLSIQVYEYYELMFGRHFPIGISADHHFRPYVSLFASCFFTMTGFHGAHVTGGVILLSCIWIQAFLGTYTPDHHSPVELAG
ncbi:MAG TPA: cytochrome c oxidase subunit 3, partial [Isosphaeraceae bacterium]|nr:cytochrome c oxidase subunit 3 [Isosphaeraceae bacterium]